MKKTILLIWDGFGYSENTEHNAIRLANTPHYDYCWQTFPHSLLLTGGKAVGLPEGVMGNSEVGHLSIGSGRIIQQDLTRISQYAEEHGFDQLPLFQSLFKDNKVIHLIGLLSDGGVHSEFGHLVEILRAAEKLQSPAKILIHVITDGRDTPPKSGIQYIQKLENLLKSHSKAQIATVMGRYYAMDRDQRWDRVQKAYNALTSTSSKAFTTATEALLDAYNSGETDEFVSPRAVSGTPRVNTQDAFLFFNFRADRAREISQAFGLAAFEHFPTPVKIQPNKWVTFTRYQEDFPFPVLFEREKPRKILGELVANRELTQLRIAETEKYAHVTYFFNGGEEEVFPKEDRILVPSPKSVPTYDLMPEMSVFEVTQKLIKAVEEKEYDFVVVNFANGDMVGHTGDEKASIQAVEAMDQCLGELLKLREKHNYQIILSSDHGNVEQMVDTNTGEPMTAHSLNPVPFIWISEEAIGKKIKDGTLADIAPTLLDIWNWTKPPEMTGQSLIIK